MAKVTSRGIQEGKFEDLGWTLYANGKKVKSFYGLKEAVISFEMKHKDKVVWKDGTWIWENLPSFMRRNAGERLYHCYYNDNYIVDYLSNQHITPNFYTSKGELRVSWFNNLLSRIEEAPESYETSRRADSMAEEWESLKEHEWILKRFQDCFVKDSITKKWMYKWSTINPVLQEHKIFVCSKKSFQVITTSKDNVERLETPLRSYIILSEDNLSMVEIGGVSIPSSLADYLLVRGDVISCKECGTKEWKHSSIFGLCKNCCEFTAEELQVERYSTKAEQRYGFVIHERNKKPHEKIKFFGVELEYEADGDLTHATYFAKKNIQKHIICKSDGSINHGIEIVSAPADITSHLEKFEPFFSKFESGPLMPQSNTGMHVHVDKGEPIHDEDGNVISYSKMNYLTLGKLSKFLQSKENESFIAKIAGRGACHYSKLGTDDTLSMAFRSRRNEGDRYKGLNLNNSRTIEFRIFASPRDFATFSKNLEFCDAITDFCMPANSSLKSLTEDHFRKYVASHAQAYPHLAKFLRTNA